MFFVPMGVLKNKNWFTEVQVSDEHIEVMRRCLWHSVRWAEEIIEKFYLKKPHHYPLRLLLKMFLGYVRRRAREVERMLGLAPIEVEAAY